MEGAARQRPEWLCALRLGKLETRLSRRVYVSILRPSYSPEQAAEQATDQTAEQSASLIKPTELCREAQEHALLQKISSTAPNLPNAKRALPMIRRVREDLP